MSSVETCTVPDGTYGLTLVDNAFNQIFFKFKTDLSPYSTQICIGCYASNLHEKAIVTVSLAHDCDEMTVAGDMSTVVFY